MLVAEIMNRSVISCAPEESASHAARLMAAYNVGSLPVCAQNGRLRGIVTDRDIVLRCVSQDTDPETTPISEIMTRAVTSVTPGDEVSEAAGKMGQSRVRRLPVVKEGKVVGMLSLCDISRRPSCDMEAAKAFCEVSANVLRK